MSECDRFERSIQAHVSGDPIGGEWDALIEHCKSCPGCRRLMALHADLTDLGAELVELDDAGLDIVRERVLDRVARQGRPAPNRTWISWLPLSPALRPLAAAALALLVLVSGIVIGAGSARLRTDRTDPLLSQINNEAISNQRLADVEDSPFTYSNVSFRRIDDERVALAFDVTRHVQAVEPVQSELVKEVLVHSLLNPSQTGARLKAISYAAEMIEPKVRDALIFAMHRDENLAVRQKALGILGSYPADETVKAAVLTTLMTDESVQMRLLALDQLASGNTDHDWIRRALEETKSGADPTLLVRLAEYER